MKTGRIYIIKNTVNSKVYIGQTKGTVHNRLVQHMKPSTVRSRGSYKFYRAVKELGADKFYAETLEENVPLEKLDDREIAWIAEYDSFHNGYNATPGGDGRIINVANNQEEMLRLASDGRNAHELAERFNVNAATIIRTLHKLGFYYRPSQALIIEMAESGMKNTEIATVLNCHPATVSRALTRVNKRKHRVPAKLREAFSYEDLRNDYFNQMPICELCAKYGITKTTFYRIKMQEKIATRPQIYAHKTRYYN